MPSVIRSSVRWLVLARHCMFGAVKGRCGSATVKFAVALSARAGDSCLSCTCLPHSTRHTAKKARAWARVTSVSPKSPKRRGSRSTCAPKNSTTTFIKVCKTIHANTL